MTVETNDIDENVFAGALTTLSVPYRRFSIMVLCAGFVILLGSTLYAYHEKSKVLTGSENSAAILEIKLQGRNLLRFLRNAESGQRGFLLTEDREYLRPYYKSVMDYAGLETSIRQIKDQQPATAELIDRLLENSAKKMVELQRSLQAYENGGKAAALSVVNSDEGLNLMALIEDDLARFDALQNQRLVRNSRRFEQALDVLTVTLVASVLTILGLAAISVMFTRRQFIDIEENHRNLVKLNSELDHRVEAATRDLSTARERAEEEAVRAERERSRVELLLREMNHRVGNNLAMVSSLIGIQASRAPSEETKKALEAARGRIALVGSAQRRLRIGANLASTDGATLLEDTIEDIKKNSPNPGVVITAESDHVILESRDAVTMAIMAGELVVNALKHAFPEDRTGWIKVRFKQQGQNAHKLEVEDNGVGFGPDEGNQSNGLGSQIIQRFCVQYDAQIERTSTPGEGTKVSLLLKNLAPIPASEVQIDQSG